MPSIRFRPSARSGTGTLAGFLILGWRLGRALPPRHRHQLRRLLYSRLRERWARYNAGFPPGFDESVAKAIWLGSSVRGRSLVVGYRRGRRVPLAVRVLAHLLGDRAASMVLGALTAWRWAKGGGSTEARAY
jgi:protein gp37